MALRQFTLGCRFDWYKAADYDLDMKNKNDTETEENSAGSDDDTQEAFLESLPSIDEAPTESLFDLSGKTKTCVPTLTNSLIGFVFQTYLIMRFICERSVACSGAVSGMH